jgi:hypothetical protein
MPTPIPTVFRHIPIASQGQYLAHPPYQPTARSATVFHPARFAGAITIAIGPSHPSLFREIDHSAAITTKTTTKPSAFTKVKATKAFAKATSWIPTVSRARSSCVAMPVQTQLHRLPYCFGRSHGYHMAVRA